MGTYKLNGTNILGNHPVHTFYLGKLPSKVMDVLKIEVDSFKSKKQLKGFQHMLEGQIDHEYEFNMPQLAIEHLLEKSKDYLEHPAVSHLPKLYASRFSEKKLTLELLVKNPAWINFQRKYEYNPLHHHAGFLSYVIWYQIPYTSENENKLGPGYQKDNTEDHALHNGNFYFLTSNGTGGMCHDLPVDQSWEGRFTIFPSELQHGVHPFYTSNKHRITISNNFFMGIVE